MAAEEKKQVQEVSASKYIAAVGRRKTAVAVVKIYKGEGFTINKKDLKDFFTDDALPQICIAPFILMGDGAEKKYKVIAKVNGGGKSAQAEAIRLGLARALEMEDPDLRPVFKPAGYLKRDSRMKERKKYGLKKARKAAQWSKR